MRRIVLLQRNALWLALVMGLVGVVMFDLRGWGLNVTGFIALQLLVLLAARRCAAGAWPGREALASAALPGLFSLTFALRDAPGVHAIAWIALALAAYAVRLRSLCGSWEIPLHAAILRFAPTLRETVALPLRGVMQLRRPRHGQGVTDLLDVAGLARAVAVSALPVGVFAALLVSADARFERLLNQLFAFDGATLMRWVVVFAASATFALAVLYRRPVHIGELASPSPGLRGLDALVCLLALSALLAAYLVVQLSYLGTGLPAGETFAGYARHGFFELVCLTTLAVPLLCLAVWASENSASRMRLAVIRVAEIVLLMVILIAFTAVHRLVLYAQAYGLTEQRVYAAAVLAAMILALVWLWPTVLRERSERFLAGALSWVLLVSASLIMLNPQALIARVNLATTAAQPDIDYLLELSDDALPVLIENRHALAPRHRLELFTRLAARSSRRDTDWRSWSLARWRAERALASAAGR